MDGDTIQFDGDAVRAPDHPVILFIEGEGVGPDIWKAARPVLDASVRAAYGSARRIAWKEILAGQKARDAYGDWLPRETVDAIREYKVALKGPLATPVGKGIRSINVLLRRELGLYASVRPIRHLMGVPSPVKAPEKVDIVVFRENLEDVYAGIEWPHGSPEARDIIRFIGERTGIVIDADSGIGIKPMSEKNSKNLIRRAIRYALDTGRTRVTLMHKGNIMKFTEGAFREWGYELARDEFPGAAITEGECLEKFRGTQPRGTVVIDDRMADDMFQQVLLRPSRFSVIAAPNLDGDYLSDALAAQVGGVGMAPGANLGDGAAVFEAIHGTAPKYADRDVANPGALILSGEMMLRFLGWTEAADLVLKGMEKAILAGRVTRDLARLMTGAAEVSCSKFSEAIIECM